MSYYQTGIGSQGQMQGGQIGGHGNQPMHPGVSQGFGELRTGQPGPPSSQHYGSYGQQFQQNAFSINAWQAVGFNNQDELQMLFESKKSQRYNAIQSEELMHILNQSPKIRNYYKINWSMELCKIMIAMLDRSKDGLMQWQEFCELLQCLTYWYQTFCQYDQNRSGYIEATELGRCIDEKFLSFLQQSTSRHNEMLQEHMARQEAICLPLSDMKIGQ